MNKELMRLLELIKIFVKQEVLDEEFNSFVEDLKENENVTVKELIEMMETEISYWEKDWYAFQIQLLF